MGQLPEAIQRRLESEADQIIQDVQSEQSYKLIAPIWYHNRLIDQDAINRGVHVALDPEDVIMLRAAGCIE